MKATIKNVNLNRSEMYRKLAISLTGFSDDDINHLMFNTAIDYMKQMGMGDDWLAVWLKEPIFWAWWRQQWTLVDEVFWNTWKMNEGVKKARPALREKYIALHESIDSFPDDIVYEKIHSSYERMGDQIVKRITAKLI